MTSSSSVTGSPRRPAAGPVLGRGAPALPDDIVQATRSKYIEAYESLTVALSPKLRLIKH